MTRPKILAGIDVGSSKITTLIGSAGGEMEEEKVKIIGVASITSKGMRKGQIVDIEEATQGVIESVEAAERMAGYTINRVLVSVGGPQIASQNSTGVVAVAEPEGEITPEDVRRVIEAARAISLPSSREIIHVLPRTFTVDGQPGVKDPVGMSGVRLEVETHIISGSTTAIRNLSKCVSEVGANVEGLVAGGLAAAESVLTETERELGVVLVDVGGGVTNLMIYIEGAPFYSTVLPIGAKNVTNDLAIGLRISLEAAEKLKMSLSEKEKKVALPEEKKELVTEEEEKEAPKDEVDLKKLGIGEESRSVSRKTLTEGIIKPRLSELFTMVGLEIKKSEAGGLTPAGVVICGGGAQTIGVIEAAKRSLAMPVRIGLPSGISGLIDEIQEPDYAVATGLLLYGLKNESQAVPNFSFGSIGRKLPKIPVKGVVSKAWDLLKSFLP
jgi:cell division protein FtsA